nr:repeat element protein [Hyposoter didymator ichnovirus]
MNSSNNNVSRKTPAVPPLPASMNVSLSIKKIFQAAESLEFEEYQSFIQKLLHNMDMHPQIQAQLWRMSTHRFTATFLNGKPLVIRYNYDPSRLEEERVLFDVEYLFPVLGGVIPRALSRFATASQIHSFVKKHVHLNRCADCEHASCPCDLGHDQAQVRAFVQPPVNTCKYADASTIIPKQHTKDTGIRFTCCRRLATPRFERDSQHVYDRQDVEQQVALHYWHMLDAC